MTAWTLAKRKPREHANGAPGCWWCEYRVRKMTSADYDEFHRYHRTGPTGYVLEARYCHEQDSDYCTHHDGTWKVYEYGLTPKDAIARIIGDDSFRRAESLHPAHATAVRVWDRKSRIGRARDVLFRATHVEGFPRHSYVERNVESDVRERTEKDFTRELKRARLLSAAKRGTAPQDKVDAIKARVLADYKRTLARELSRHTVMLAKYNELTKVLCDDCN